MKHYPENIFLKNIFVGCVGLKYFSTFDPSFGQIDFFIGKIADRS